MTPRALPMPRWRVRRRCTGHNAPSLGMNSARSGRWLVSGLFFEMNLLRFLDHAS